MPHTNNANATHRRPSSPRPTLRRPPQNGIARLADATRTAGHPHSRAENHLDVSTDRRGTRPDDLEVGVPSAVAEIAHVARPTRVQMLKCEHMRTSQIAHVYVVANARPVGSRVVVAVDLEPALATCKRVKHPGDDVRLGIVCLPERTVRPCSRYVEVAQAERPQIPRSGSSFQFAFELQLALAVGVHWHGRRVLGDRNAGRLSIDCGCRREHHRIDASLGHRESMTLGRATLLSKYRSGSD